MSLLVCVGHHPYLHKAHSVHELEAEEGQECGEDLFCLFLLGFTVVATRIFHGMVYPTRSMLPKVAVLQEVCFQGPKKRTGDSQEGATCKALGIAYVSTQMAFSPPRCEAGMDSQGQKVVKVA